MGDTINRLQLHILRIVHTLEPDSNKDASLRCLLSTTKKELRQLDIEAWSRLVGKLNISIEDHFYEAETSTFNYRERLILFLIFNNCLDRMDDELLEVINYFADAFQITGISPMNYSLYLRMLTYPPILKMIIDSEPEDLIYSLTSIIEHVSVEDLKCESYEGAIKILCKVNKQPYSPFFFSNYSIENVYNTIKRIVGDGSNRPFFSPKDIAKLELLPQIDAIATPTFRELFSQKVQELESHFEYKKVALALAIIKLTPSLLFEARTSQFKEEAAVGGSQPQM